jgi:hypothetical protein
VNHAEPHELGRRQPRDEPQNPGLLPPLHLRLKAHEAEVVARKRVLSQLHDRVGLAAGPRIPEAHGLHRSEPQRLPPARRHDLDRQAPLEELRVVEVVHGARSAVTSASKKRPYSSAVSGQFR